MRVLGLLVVAAGLLAGCASHCPAVHAIRAQLVERESASEPHLSISVPLALASTFLDQELSQVKPLALAPAPVAAWAKLAGELDVEVSEGAFVPLGDDRVGLRVKLTVRLGRRSLFAFTVVMRLRPTFEDTGVVLAVHANDLRTLRPELGDIAKEAVGRELAKTVFGKLLDEEQLAGVADALIAFVGGAGFGLIRDHLLREAGKVTSLRLDYPPIPVRDAEIRVVEEGEQRLALQIRTALPVHTGLPPQNPPPTAGRVDVIVSGSTLAELGNWAIAEGLVPDRYNTDLDPDPNGSLAPRLDWTERDERPFTVHVFMDEPDCARVQVQAKLAARVESNTVHVDVSDGQIERVDGSWTTQLGVWLLSMGTGSVELSQRQVARFGFAIGQRRRSIAVEHAHVITSASAPDFTHVTVALR